MISALGWCSDVSLFTVSLFAQGKVTIETVVSSNHNFHSEGSRGSVFFLFFFFFFFFFVNCDAVVYKRLLALKKKAFSFTEKEVFVGISAI